MANRYFSATFEELTDGLHELADLILEEFEVPGVKHAHDTDALVFDLESFEKVCEDADAGRLKPREEG